MRRPARPHAHLSSTTIVPTPASVNSSTSSACGVRPSMMCALLTPPRTARTHACAFGIIPVDRPRGDQRLELVGVARPRGSSRQLGRARSPGDVGEEDELLGAERLGDRSGDGVGVDVVGLAAASAPIVATTGTRPPPSSRVKDRRVDGNDVADEAECGSRSGPPGSGRRPRPTARRRAPRGCSSRRRSLG